MGATPIIVPFNLLAMAALDAGLPGAGVDPARCVSAPGGGTLELRREEGGGGVLDGWFIISIVPLNLGAATLLRWKPHFEQA